MTKNGCLYIIRNRKGTLMDFEGFYMILKKGFEGNFRNSKWYWRIFMLLLGILRDFKGF